jgi:hypothetical protein
VFFPYKASRFDSFETVYLAAKDDPACDAFVVPIPYYELKSDGSLGEMHYEGAGHYGNNIECMDWREYDIKARRPDVIYIHCPYDAINDVMSVHPSYYSDRLKEYTEHLTFIPYGVSYNAFKNPEEPFDISEFIIFPAELHSDIYISRSEEVSRRHAFRLSEYRKMIKGNQHLLSQIRKGGQKFIALGSPKFDCVVNTARSDYELPTEWQSLVHDKKTILYATSVKALLENADEFIEQAHSTIEILKNKDDIVLWWRPHPLIIEALKSMRPAYANEYEQIVENYRSEKIGIYDDSADLHRAIAWSDAYYGHESSMMFLYLATGNRLQ